MHKLRKQKILITGCLGGVGSALLNRMDSLGFKVDGLDVVDRKKSCWPKKRQFICQDLSNISKTLSIIKNYDGIIHLAGYSRVQQSKLDPIGAINSNILCTANILESIRLSRRKAWLLIASSLEVKTNSEGAYGFTNMYGITKAVSELLTHCYVLDHGLIAGAARIAGVYGSLQDQRNKVPFIFAKKAISNSTLTVQQDSRLMDYIYIDDVCSGLIDAAKTLCNKKNPSFFIYKIFSHERISLINLAKKIIKLTKSRSKIKIIKNTPKTPVRIIYKNNFRSKNKLTNGLIKLANQIKISQK